MNLLLALLSLTFLVFFRSTTAFSIYTPADDANYIRILVELLNWEMPYELSQKLFYYPGTSLLWIPSAFISYFGELIFGVSRYTLLPPMVGLNSFFLICFSSVLIFLALKRSLSQFFTLNQLQFLSFMLTLVSPVLYYGTFRTCMSHAAELFSCALFLWALVSQKLIPTFLAALLVVLVRPNGFPVFLAAVALAFSQTSNLKPELLRLLKVLSIAFLLIATITAGYVALSGTYNDGNSDAFFTAFKNLNLSEVRHVLFGGNFGLFWTAPWWLLMLIMSLFFYRSLNLISKACAVWLWSHFVLCVYAGHHGADFGYRYIIGTYMAGIYIFTQLWPHISPKWRQAHQYILRINVIWMLYLTWVYKVDPSVHMQPAGARTWDNPSMQVNALKLLASPFDLATPLIQSPLGTLMTSLFLPKESFFYRQHYELQGPPLYILIATTLFFLCGFIYNGRRYWQNRK